MKCKLADIAELNPKESLKKGTVAKKVAMDQLQPFCRDIPGYTLETFNGGTKFRNGDTLFMAGMVCEVIQIIQILVEIVQLLVDRELSVVMYAISAEKHI